MKDNYRYFSEFIAEQKSFFEDALLPEVNDGITDTKELYSWEKREWKYGPSSRGFLSKAPSLLVFDEIKAANTKGLFKPGEQESKSIAVDKTYADFMKAYCTSLYRNGNPSGISVLAQQLLLKRVYVRMLMAGTEPHPVNITSEFLQDATDMVAQSRTGSSAISNSSKDYDDANVIARHLNYVGFTLTQIEVQKKQKTVGSNYTQASKKAQKAHYGSDLDDDEHEKNLSIQTFLNVVALRGMVQEDGEKIVFNLVLLLMVTGFRHMEAATIRYDSMKVVEIEDKATKALMEKRGLPTYFVGIKYLGEKGAGYRTHWIEPLAVSLVEELWNSTLALTEKLRSHVKYLRSTSFQSYLPETWFKRQQQSNVIELDSPLVTLDEIVDDVYESVSATVAVRGRSGARDYAKKKITKSGLDIKPYSEIKLEGARKEISYKQSDIDRFIRNAIESNAETSNDLIFRKTDSKTGAVNETPYEELLFIIQQGSGATTYTGTLKVVPQVITATVLKPFLGYGAKGRAISIFAKYNLTDENGEFTRMYSHTPRHGINTFYAIAGVSEHLQAMFMGRKDFSQNESYQHLAIEEKAISSALVTVGNTEPVLNEATALARIKEQGIMSLNPKLSPTNALAQTLHTHTTPKDKASFVVDVVNHSDSDVFSEFDELFELMEDAEKQEVALPHADLSAMDIGSCMRKLATFQCPYNMKCQDGSPCPYFTLTGRQDELAKIEHLAACIESKIAVINQMELTGHIDVEEADEILESLSIRRQNIKYHLGQSQTFENEKIQIDLLELNGLKKPKMLSSLFALEQREIEKAKGS
ncbi:hypothetical protein [Shewanella indica]|uniref:hypothetical protein n=1 Tax=Shewanella indica TaxID=768528 RepID=UPI0030074BE3